MSTFVFMSDATNTGLAFPPAPGSAAFSGNTMYPTVETVVRLVPSDEVEAYAIDSWRRIAGSGVLGETFVVTTDSKRAGLRFTPASVWKATRYASVKDMLRAYGPNRASTPLGTLR